MYEENYSIGQHLKDHEILNIKSFITTDDLVAGFTPGSVLFIDSIPSLAQDSVNLFWDDVTKRLGVKTNTPGYTLDVAGIINTNTGYYLNGSAVTHGDMDDMPDSGGTNTDHDNRYLHRSLVNGTFKESFDALAVTRNSDTEVWVTLEQSGNGDLTMQFSDFDTTLDCTGQATPSTFCEVELTVGTDAGPQTNYVYVPQATKTLTCSTSNFPTDAEHIKVGFFLVPSAAYTATDGIYINQNWNDHLSSTDLQGHLSHMAERSRRDGAYWFSGVTPDGDASTYLWDDTGGAGGYHFKSAAGVIYQMHRHSISAKNTKTDDVHVVNWNGDAYHDIHDLADIVDDSKGVTLNNKFFNLVFWGVGNKTGEYAPIMCNLPDGSYNTLSDAQADVDGHDVLTMPREFNLESSTGFLIVRMTVRQSGGTWVHHAQVDLRGQTPSTASGGASGVATAFSDNQFTIFDDSDITSIMAFDASGISSTTRTLIIPDADGTLAILELAQTFTAAQIIDGASDTVQLTVQGYANGGEQTANIFVVEQSDGTDIFQVDSTGNVTLGAGLDVDNVVEVYDTVTLAFTYGYDSVDDEFKITSGPMDRSNDEIRVDVDKLGFFNTAPAVQPSAYTQTYSTANKTVENPTGVTMGDLVATSGGWGASSEVNFDKITTAVDQLIADNLDLRQVITSMIDDLQILGLAQ